MKTFTLRKRLINLLLETVGINTGMNLQFVSVVSLLVIRILDISPFWLLTVLFKDYHFQMTELISLELEAH